MPEQLGFDMPSDPALSRADFLVTPANAMALDTIEDTANWPGKKLVLTGPEGAGKTHLVHIWASLTQARVVAARDLTEATVPDLSTAPVAVEDVPDIAKDANAQTALFHLHNLVLAEGQALLMTGRGTPAHWGLELPDLISRIAGAQMVELKPPDDALLAAVLAKLFADRQLTPKADLIPFLLARMDRSFAAARAVVDHLDAASLAQQKPLTRSFAAGLLDKDG